jgi:hypothetical protein
MAGPFARLRRGEGAQPEPDAPTQVSATADPATAEAQAAPSAAAPAADPAGPGADAATAAAADGAVAPDAEATPADVLPGEPTPGFVQRGRLRRRLRFVRRAREVALRDLGGLVFDLHRFGRERTDLVDQKLAALSTLDGEMRTLETALDERRDVTVLREPGLASCPRCGALHASDAAYCSACGLPVGRGASLPTGPSLAGPISQLPPGGGSDTVLVRPEPGGPGAPGGAAEPGDGAAPVDALTAQHPTSAPAGDEQPTSTP